MDIMDKAELMERLPRVGDRRMEYPTPKAFDQAVPQRKRCVVVEVNRAHLWYRVRFADTGQHECYKLPETRRSANG